MNTRGHFPIPGLREKLVLTYDNTKIPDGAGAQLQRIYGMYGIARLLGATYLHTPIDHIMNQGLASWERNVVDPDYHRPFNDLFRLPSDPLPADAFHEVELGNISIGTVEDLRIAFDSGDTGGRPCLARVVVPYGIADQFPDCYEVCKELSPFTSIPREGRRLRVALHVRRGELLIVATARALSDAYYIAVAQRVGALLDARGIEHQIEVHTEAAVTPFTVQPGYPGTSADMAPTVITPEMCKLDEFNVLPNVVYCINDSPIDCLRKLATADVLVMSRSSFSYVGAILNQAGVVLYHPFWHSALSSWLSVEPDGRFDESRLGEVIDHGRGVTPRIATGGGTAPLEGAGDSQLGPVAVPPNRYLPLGRAAGSIFLEGLDGPFSADRICITGWRAPDDRGIASDGPEATVRFRATAPVGSSVHLVMRLTAANGDPCRLRIMSASGAETELGLAGESDGAAILSCRVEPGQLVTVRVVMVEPTGDEGARPPSWRLRGLLYVDPEAALRERRAAMIAASPSSRR